MSEKDNLVSALSEVNEQRIDNSDSAKYKLTHREKHNERCIDTIIADSWDEAMDLVRSPRENFDVDGQDVVGIKENRRENFRFDIMVDPSVGPDAFIQQHSYVEVRRVTDE